MNVRKPGRLLRRGVPALYLFVIAFVLAVASIGSAYAHLPNSQSIIANRYWILLAAFVVMAVAAVMPDA